MESKNYIKQKLSVTELLAGLAEESSELAQAALKLRRCYDQTNPTPVPEEEAIEHLYEEIADVLLYINCLSINMQDVAEKIHAKSERWVARLKETSGK